MVLFVLDISGRYVMSEVIIDEASMCVSYEVEGTVKLRGHEKIEKLKQDTSEFQERTQSGIVADQFLPNEKRGITYVTRL